MRSTTCPDSDQMRDFAGGRLPADESAALLEHVSQCPSCQDRIRAVETIDGNTVANESRTDLTAQPDAEPAYFGKYELLEQIGQGGMGQVFKARQTHLDKIVALKLLDQDRLHSPETASRFRREIDTISRLNDPHIVKALDAGAVDGAPYLAMEWIDGETLSDLVKRRGPLPAREACELVRQAALGLQHAHENGIIHRDVKPSNLIVSVGIVKVLDLGLALSVADNEVKNATREDKILGTADYIAPEQANQSHDVNAQADVYGLGCTLYFLLAGRAPFHDKSSKVEKLLAHQYEEPPHPRNLPRGLTECVLRMMAKTPDKRIASMSGVIAVLEPFATGQVRRRSHSRLLAAALVLLVASAGAGVYFWQRPDPPAAKPPNDPANKELPKREKPGDPDRTAAEWVLRMGGSVEIVSERGGKQSVGPKGQLPGEPFQLHVANFLDRADITDDSLELFEHLIHISALTLAGPD